MPERHFRPGPGRFGVQAALIQGFNIANLTANTTTRVDIGPAPRKSFLDRVMVSQSTLVADADGTVLATVKKYDASADASVTLSSALSLEADAQVASEGKLFTLLSTLTDAQRTLDEGDVLYVDIVNNSAAIDTQPVNLRFVASVEVLN